ncbi:hypothetical protein ACF0H5_016985 [Mactra antiquata]
MKLNYGFSCAINVCILFFIFDGIEGQGRGSRNRSNPRGRGHRGNPFRGRRMHLPGVVPNRGRLSNHLLTDGRSLTFRGRQRQNIFPGQAARGQWKSFATRYPILTTSLPSVTTEKQLTPVERARIARLQNIRTWRLQEHLGTQNNTDMSILAKRFREFHKQRGVENPEIIPGEPLGNGLSKKEENNLKRMARLKALRERKQLAQERRKQLQELRRKAKQTRNNPIPEDISSTDQLVPNTAQTKQTIPMVSSTTPVSPTSVQPDVTVKSENVEQLNKTTTLPTDSMINPPKAANHTKPPNSVSGIENTGTPTTKEGVTVIPSSQVGLVDVNGEVPLQPIVTDRTGPSKGKVNISASNSPNETIEGPSPGSVEMDSVRPLTVPTIEPSSGNMEHNLGTTNESPHPNSNKSLDTNVTATDTSIQEHNPNLGPSIGTVESSAIKSGVKIGPKGEAMRSSDPNFAEPFELNTGDPFWQNEQNNGTFLGSNVESNTGELLGIGNGTSELPLEPGTNVHGDPIEAVDFNVGLPVDPVTNSGVPVDISNPNTGTPLGTMDSSNQGDPLGSQENLGTPLGASDIWPDYEIGVGIPVVFEDINLTDFFGATDTASQTNTQNSTSVVNEAPAGILTISGELMPIAGQTQTAGKTDAKLTDELTTVKPPPTTSSSAHKWSFHGFALDISKKLKRP